MKEPWYESDNPDRVMRAGGLRLGVAVVVAALFFGLLGLGGWALKVAFAPVKGAGDQVIKTKGNADYRIAAYDRFYDLCGSIQTAEDRLAIARQQVKQEKDPARKSQLQTNVLALEGTRAELVRQYNADASKAGTRAQFRASDLPYSIDVNQENTTCAR